MDVLLFTRSNLDISISAQLHNVVLERRDGLLRLELSCSAPDFVMDITMLTKPVHKSVNDFISTYHDVFLTRVCDVKCGLMRAPILTASPLLLINSGGLYLYARSFNTVYITADNGALRNIFLPEHGIFVSFTTEEQSKFATEFQQFIHHCEHGWEEEHTQEQNAVFLYTPRILSE